MKPGQDDFYVGYVDRAPPVLGRWLRRLTASALTASVAAAVLLAAGQRPLPESRFEFGTTTEWSGFLIADPFPALIVESERENARIHLVDPGKHGAGETLAPFADRWITLSGTLIQRGDQRMLEVVPGSVRTREDQSAPPRPDRIADLGVHYVEGEVVGSKCFLGVMNPGSGVVHRACARLCIQGGVPLMLAVRQPDGSREGWVLTGPEGNQPGDVWLDFAAEAVGVTGRVVRVGSTTFLHVDPLNIRRLD